MSKTPPSTPCARRWTSLLNALAGEKIKVIHEPKRDETGKGAPDFKFKTNDERILGYLENKKID